MLTLVKQRGSTINGPVLRVCRERLIADKVDGKPTIAKAARLIDVTPQLWSQWESGGRRISEEKLELLDDLFELTDAAPLLTATAVEAEEIAEDRRTRRNSGLAA